MNSLALLPILAAATLAAPGPHVLLNQVQPAVGYAQVQNSVGYAQVQNAVGYTQVQPAVGYTQVQPAVGYAQVQVPLTQSVHYQSQPVVTGYSATVVKPDLSNVQLAVPSISSQIAYGRQLPELTPPPNDQIPTTPPPLGDFPTPPALTPPTSAPPSENGTSGDQGGSQIPIPGSPIVAGSGGVNLLQVVNPIQLQYSNLAVAQPLAVQNAGVVESRSVPVAAVRAAQAGDYEPLVTKEKVYAPVRTNIQYTPQYTQIQPEITVRQIVHDVPVNTVSVHTPVVQQLVQGQTLVQDAKIIRA